MPKPPSDGCRDGRADQCSHEAHLTRQSPPVFSVNPDFINVLKVMTYLALGTVSIALFGAWILNRFGPRK